MLSYEEEVKGSAYMLLFDPVKKPQKGRYSFPCVRAGDWPQEDPSQVPISMDAQVPYIKLHSIQILLYPLNHL
jgi:hypothetical protein